VGGGGVHKEKNAPTSLKKELKGNGPRRAKLKLGDDAVGGKKNRMSGSRMRGKVPKIGDWHNTESGESGVFGRAGSVPERSAEPFKDVLVPRRRGSKRGSVVLNSGKKGGWSR